MPYGFIKIGWQKYILLSICNEIPFFTEIIFIFIDEEGRLLNLKTVIFTSTNKNSQYVQ